MLGRAPARQAARGQESPALHEIIGSIRVLHVVAGFVAFVVALLLRLRDERRTELVVARDRVRPLKQRLDLL